MRGITILGVLFLVGCHCPRVEVRYVPRPQRAARETTEGPTILSFKDWLTTQPWGPAFMTKRRVPRSQQEFIERRYENYVDQQKFLLLLAQNERYLRVLADEPPPDRPVDSGVVEHSGQEPEPDLP